MAVQATVLHHHKVNHYETGISSANLSSHWTHLFSRSAAGRSSAHFTDSTTGSSIPTLAKSGTHALYVSQAHVAKELNKFKEESYKPWEDDSGKVIWSPLRTAAAKVVLDRRFEHLMICVILFNLCVIVVESDRVAKCYPDYKNNIDGCSDNPDNITFFRVVNSTLLLWYIAECLVKITVLRAVFFRSKENLLDLFIVSAAILAEVAGSLVNVSWLRVLRIARLFRTVQIVTKVPELYMLITGFKGSMKAMFFGAGLLLGLLGFFSILLVQLIHPINVDLVYDDCNDCHLGYSTVMLSTLTLFQQIVAGDSWGKLSVPIIKRSPWWGLLLPFVQIVVGVGAMNLILAVVVDRAQEARDNNKEKMLQDKIREAHARQETLLLLFKELDSDQSGNLQLDEIKQAFKSSHEFQKMLMLSGITEDELYEVFKFCDRQGTGDVSYLRLCKTLDEVQAGDMRKACMMTKMHIQTLNERMNKQDLILRLHRDLLERIDSKLMSRASADSTSELYPLHTSPANSSLSSRRQASKGRKMATGRSSVTFSERGSGDEIPTRSQSPGAAETIIINESTCIGSGNHVESMEESIVESAMGSVMESVVEEQFESLGRDSGAKDGLFITPRSPRARAYSNGSAADPPNGSDKPSKLQSMASVTVTASKLKDEFKQLRLDLAEIEFRTESIWQDAKRRASSLRNHMDRLEATLALTDCSEPMSMRLGEGPLEEQALSQLSVSLACLQSAFLQARHSALVDLEQALSQEDNLMSSHRRFLCRSLSDVTFNWTSGPSTLSGRVQI